MQRPGLVLNNEAKHASPFSHPFDHCAVARFQQCRKCVSTIGNKVAPRHGLQ